MTREEIERLFSAFQNFCRTQELHQDYAYSLLGIVVMASLEK